MKNILGVSGFYHDSAAVLLTDGEIVAAAQEERFTRKKHDSAFPSNAVAYCLKAGGISGADLDHVAFYDKPLLKFERLVETYMSYAPAGFRSFAAAMPVWLRQKLKLRGQLNEGMGGEYSGRYVYTEHHESHAASAFYPSPFEEAAILTIDGVGEWATSTIGTGRGNRIELLEEQRFPHSLGLLYSAFTYYTGFRVNSGEYKLMGLAPYGEPKYADIVRDKLIDLRDDGSFRLDMSHFNYCQGLTMVNQRFCDLFGQPARPPEGGLTQFHMDIAASIQVVTEEIVMLMAGHARELTGMKNLCMAGGVALNCVANGKILRDGPFENLWIQPAAGDAGGALGAAQFVWYQLLQNPREVTLPDGQSSSYLGPSFSNEEIRTFLDSQEAVYDFHEAEEDLTEAVSTLIADQNVIGWFQGRMEFGPRALGARSILGDARSEKMQSVMNLKIKFRESFRPFAPIVLRDHVHEYFEMEPGTASPYMLLVAPVNEDQRLDQTEAVQKAVGLDKLNLKRSKIPAVTHVDYSARVQTVEAERNPRLAGMMEKFKDLTDCPVLINTSFNVRGEPIVCTPEEAYRCFMATNMDVLVLENCVLKKSEQKAGASSSDQVRDEYLAQFKLD